MVRWPSAARPAAAADDAAVGPPPIAKCPLIGSLIDAADSTAVRSAVARQSFRQVGTGASTDRATLKIDIMGDTPSAAAAVAEYTRLMSLAVHELRTPTSVVGGYLRMLQKDTSAELSERQRRMIDEAEKSCARLAALIGELSDLSKLDAGTAAVKTERFDIFQLVVEVAQEIHEGQDREVQLDTPRSDLRRSDHRRSDAPQDRIRSHRARRGARAAGGYQGGRGVETRDAGWTTGRVRDRGAGTGSAARARVTPGFVRRRSGRARARAAHRSTGLRSPWRPRLVGAARTQGVELPVGSRGAIVASLPLSE